MVIFMDKLVLVNKNNMIDSDFIDSVLLVEVDSIYGDKILVEEETFYFYQKLKEFLLGMGIAIGIDSGYRSLEHQQKNYSDFIIKYGKEYADSIVAPVGCSEHHTGLAIDISIKVDNEFLIDNYDLMKNENIYLEIHKHLSKFGFILRYPKGKEDITGYPYEPWHIRYVGVEVAKKIYEENLTLEEYLLLYK